MTADEAAKIAARLGTTFTPMTEAKVVVWMEFLAPLQFDRALDTCRTMRDTQDRMPSIAKFKEAYEALHYKYKQPGYLLRPQCGVCDDGWVPSRCNTAYGNCDCGYEYTRRGDRCPKGYHTVARCPNGCKPMTVDERHQHDRDEDMREQERWRRMTPEQREAEKENVRRQIAVLAERFRLGDFTEPKLKPEERIEQRRAAEARDFTESATRTEEEIF